MPSVAYVVFWRTRSLIRRLSQFMKVPSQASLWEDQINRFEALGLQREVSASTNLSKGSEHWQLFLAISRSFESISCSPKILEIGTFDGKFTRRLSELFPKSPITTIDLPIGRGFWNEYGRSNPEAYVLERELNLEGKENIRFLEANSLELTNWSERFDLIWVDGDHRLPVVAIDISNALRLVTEDGLVVIDDVFLQTPDPESSLASTGALRTLENFKSAGLITGWSLVRKRLSPQKNLKWNTKFIAVVRAKGPQGLSGENSKQT